MADADDVRRLALALPHVEEIDSDGFDFRVGGKGFVWSYPERQPGQRRVLRTDIAVLYVGDEAEKQALLLGEPAAVLHHAGLRRLAAGDAAAGRGGRRAAGRAGHRRVADARPGASSPPISTPRRLERSSVTRFRFQGVCRLAE